MQNKLILLLKLLSIAFLIYFAFFTYSKLKFIKKKVIHQNEQLSFLREEHSINNKSIINAFIAEKAFKITQNIESDEEKCLAVAKWVSSNISNRENSQNSLQRSFASRSGLCGYRSRIFVEMLSMINIPAKVFNIYNYPRIGGGHSCAQVYYNDSWHFFDLMYAGYFKKGNKILSFKEIVEEAKNKNHLNCLVVFEKTLDALITIDFINAFDEPSVIYRKSKNSDRMLSFYKNINKVKTFGFFQSPFPKKLNINFNASNRSKNYSLGHTNMEYKEFNDLAIQEKLTENLGVIGKCTDNFEHRWNFKNLDIGKVYTLKLYTYHTPCNHANKDKINMESFYAKTNEGAQIINGSNNNPEKEIWEIQFKALSKNAVLDIEYKKVEGNFDNLCLLINKIEIN